MTDVVRVLAVRGRRTRPDEPAVPRARHDAGLEPVDWPRVVLVGLVVLGAAAAALLVAALFGAGPLAGHLGAHQIRLQFG